MGASVKQQEGAVLESRTVPRRAASRPERMVLTARDQQLVKWVYDAPLATREQLQRLFFTPAGRSLAQRRLTLLYRNRYLDKLPGRAVNALDVYRLSRRAFRGLRLLREMCPQEAIRPRPIAEAKVDHALDIASCKVALIISCQAAGFALPVWLREDELSERMQATGILPDAYFQIARPGPGRPTTASFFLEVERSGKSEKALEQKIRRYGDFYYGGKYETAFGTKALRVLVLFGSDYGMNPQRQIERCLMIARRLEVTMLRFATLDTFLSCPAARLLAEPIWHQPRDEVLSALFG